MNHITRDKDVPLDFSIQVLKVTIQIFSPQNCKSSVSQDYSTNYSKKLCSLAVLIWLTARAKQSVNEPAIIIVLPLPATAHIKISTPNVVLLIFSSQVFQNILKQLIGQSFEREGELKIVTTITYLPRCQKGEHYRKQLQNLQPRTFLELWKVAYMPMSIPYCLQYWQKRRCIELGSSFIQIS